MLNSPGWVLDDHWNNLPAQLEHGCPGLRRRGSEEVGEDEDEAASRQRAPRVGQVVEGLRQIVSATRDTNVRQVTLFTRRLLLAVRRPPEGLRFAVRVVEIAHEPSGLRCAVGDLTPGFEHDDGL